MNGFLDVVRDVGREATDAPARREVDARIAAVEERVAEPAVLEVEQPNTVADPVAVVGTRVAVKQRVAVPEAVPVEAGD